MSGEVHGVGTLKQIVIFILLCLFLVNFMHVFDAKSSPSNPNNPPMPAPLPLKTYRIMVVSGGDVAGHDVPFIDVKANTCDSSYQSEVFDGRKTPLLKVVCKNIGWYWHVCGITCNDDGWRPQYWGGDIVFQGLADSYQMISTGE